MNNFKPGDKVTYINHGRNERGIIKTIANDGNPWIVYKCDDWENYQNYTGVKTDRDMIVPGWLE